MSKYTFEVCKELANNCKSRTEMSQKHSMAYKMSCKYKWIDLFFPLKRRRLTFDVCKEKAKNFSTRAEFLKADESNGFNPLDLFNAFAVICNSV